MHRRRPSTSLFIAASLIAALAAIACSAPPEQPILNQFFTASRLRDNTSLQNFATVAFDPRTDGTVSGFSVESVSPEQRKPLNVKALAQAVDDVRAEDDAYNKRKRDFYNANEEAVSRVLKADRDNATVKGKDAEVQTTWSKFVDEGKVLSKKITDAKNKLAAESTLVALSFSDNQKSPDYKKTDGELITKDVTVSANVKLPGGQSTKKTLIVTMQRAVIKTTPETLGRWVITSVKDTAAPAATKSS
jgi:hypothetical protein